MGWTNCSLNSFWAKPTEPNNSFKTRKIADPHDQFRFYATPDIEVTNLLFTGDDVIWVTWKYMEKKDNINILRYTNGWCVLTGTLHILYVYLVVLKDRPIYCVAILYSTYNSAGSLWHWRVGTGWVT